jgi:hypothetical protein
MLGGGNGGPSGSQPQPTPDADGFVTQAPAPKTINPLLMNPASADLVYGPAREALSTAQNQSIAAQGLNTQLAQLSDLTKSLPDAGLLAQGSGFNQRTDMVKALNTALGTVGIAPIDPNNVATAEDVKKIATQLQAAVADSWKSDPAASTIVQAASASPSGENTKEGLQRIIGNIEALNKRAVDRNAYLQDWASKNYGSLSGADAAFNEANPPQKYVEYGKQLANPIGSAGNPLVPKSQSDIDNAPSGTVFNVNGKMMVKR